MKWDETNISEIGFTWGRKSPGPRRFNTHSKKGNEATKKASRKQAQKQVIYYQKFYKPKNSELQKYKIHPRNYAGHIPKTKNITIPHKVHVGGEWVKSEQILKHVYNTLIDVANISYTAYRDTLKTSRQIADGMDTMIQAYNNAIDYSDKKINSVVKEINTRFYEIKGKLENIRAEAQKGIKVLNNTINKSNITLKDINTHNISANKYLKSVSGDIKELKEKIKYLNQHGKNQEQYLNEISKTLKSINNKLDTGRRILKL